MVRRITFNFILSGLILSTSLNATTEDALSMVTAQGFGTVDSAVATGSRGKMMARRAATLDAQRNLLEVIEGVRITSGTTVKDMTLQSDIIGSRVKGMLRGAFTINENLFEEDGTWVAEVELAVCLNSSALSCREKPTLSALVQPELKKPEPEEVFQPEVAVVEVSEQVESEESSTGLIIDVSSQDFSPLLDVRVRTEEGKELYGPGHVGTGIDWVHWANSVDNAQSMTDVVGDTPMVVPAVSLGENSEIFVSQENAIDIFTRNLQGDDFLQQGKVVFVVN